MDPLKSKIIVRPVFDGCGYIDASEGDVILGDVIYEVKTVERQFRGTDIRQVVTYAALNSLSKQYTVSNIGLFNPRSGMYFQENIDVLCWEISGKTGQELFSEIEKAISSGETSR